MKIAEGAANLTLKDVITLAIKTSLPDDSHLPLDQKLALSKIGEIVYSKDGELDTAQATMIKERIAKVFTAPALAGAVNSIIEGK